MLRQAATRSSCPAARLSFADAAPAAARVLQRHRPRRRGLHGPDRARRPRRSTTTARCSTSSRPRPACRLTPLRPRAARRSSSRSAGKTARLPVTIGVVTENVYTFDHADEATRWNPNGTAPATQQLADAGRPPAAHLPGPPQHGHQLADRRDAAGGRRARRCASACGCGRRTRSQYSNLSYVDAGGTSRSPLGSPISPGWNDLRVDAAGRRPVPDPLSAFQVIETNVARQDDGAVIFDKLEVDNSVEVPSPPLEPLRQDPLFSPDGTTNGRTTGRSRRSPTSSSRPPPGAGQDRHRRAAAHPPTNADLVVLNGDITDLGARRRPGRSPGRRSRPAAAT